MMLAAILAATDVVGELPKLEDAKLDTFLTEVYGKRPVERPTELWFRDIYPPEKFERNPVKGIKRKIDALRRIIICHYRGPYAEGSFRFTVFLPKDAKGPVPAFLYISLGYGGADIDPWRSEQSERWPAEQIVDRGYAAIGFAREEISPECYDPEFAFKEGVFRCFEDPSQPRAPDAWGALSAWAWAASRVMDWIETCPQIDAKRVAVVGHSRGGKTALLAGVTDKRFALTVSNCSGCGGARLYHVDLPECEHIHQIRKSVSYWFCGNYAKWEHKDTELPFDQHQWLSLIAPRLLYVASGSLDAWAGPEGEKLATDLARPAWGDRGEIDVGYHLREGKHRLTAYDWNKFMDFTDAHGWLQPAAEPALPDERPPAAKKDDPAPPVGASVPVVPAPREVVPGEGVCRVGVDFFEHAAEKWTKDATLPKEGYRLEIRPEGVTISAADAAGAFYAVETMKQLCPTNDAGQTFYDIAWYRKHLMRGSPLKPHVGAEGKRVHREMTRSYEAGFTLPCLTIKDWPEFPWRGIMVDSGRNFQDRDAMMALMDRMASFKMNVLQLHFTEDQGWRLEIPGMPELVEYGSVRPSTSSYGVGVLYPKGFDSPSEQEMDGMRNGPFYYTVQDIRDLNAYAKARHITLVPEIEMPGHCRAFLAAYPELSCVGESLPRVPRCMTGIEKDVMCVGNEKLLPVLERIFDYVCEAFPDSPVIHVGGDECFPERWSKCPKCQAFMKREGLGNERELQSWLVARITKHLAEKGRRTMGWDGIMNGFALDRKQTIVHFRQPRPGCPAKTAAEAAELGYAIVNGPTKFTFANRSQDIEDDPSWYREWAPDPVSAEAIYGFDPAAGVKAAFRGNILGSQMNAFGEYMRGRGDMEWKLWPRSCAMAETLWSGPSKPGYADFYRRVQPLRKRMIHEHCNAARLSIPKGVRASGEVDASQSKQWKTFMPDL